LRNEFLAPSPEQTLDSLRGGVIELVLDGTTEALIDPSVLPQHPYSLFHILWEGAVRCHQQAAVVVDNNSCLGLDDAEQSVK